MLPSPSLELFHTFLTPSFLFFSYHLHKQCCTPLIQASITYIFHSLFPHPPPFAPFNFPEPSRVYILSLSLHLDLDASDPHLHICLPATTPHIIEICRVLLVFCKQGLKWDSSAQAASLLSTITGWTTSLYCLQQYVVLLFLSK